LAYVPYRQVFQENKTNIELFVAANRGAVSHSERAIFLEYSGDGDIYHWKVYDL
jgi:hypothetical protein